jgi:hypothetical protein
MSVARCASAAEGATMLVLGVRGGARRVPGGDESDRFAPPLSAAADVAKWPCECCALLRPAEGLGGGSVGPRYGKKKTNRMLATRNERVSDIRTLSIAL